jgi:hypothetical protein
MAFLLNNERSICVDLQCARVFTLTHQSGQLINRARPRNSHRLGASRSITPAWQKDPKASTADTPRGQQILSFVLNAVAFGTHASPLQDPAAFV